jgi:hypothetical protein
MDYGAVLIIAIQSLNCKRELWWGLVIESHAENIRDRGSCREY